ncbi:MAG: hypothetical protein MUF81_05855 [Verrucomicrobia bacterium]|nr:hypothetical protein [Verrucomicrobiota bacterium]
MEGERGKGGRSGIAATNWLGTGRARHSVRAGVGDIRERRARSDAPYLGGYGGMDFERAAGGPRAQGGSVVRGN